MIDDGGAGRKPANVSLKWNLSALALLASAGGAGAASAATATDTGGITVDLQGEYGFEGKDLSNFANPAPGVENPRIGPGGNGYDILGSVTYQPTGNDLSFI